MEQSDTAEEGCHPASRPKGNSVPPPELGFGQLCGVAERVDDAVAEGGAEFCRLALAPGGEETLLPPELAPNRGERVSEGGPLLAVPSCS